MGACFAVFGCKAESSIDAVKRCRERIEESRYQDGHSYSGEIGMADGVSMTHKQFDDGNDAYDWLEENAEKWGPALGVKVGKDEFLFGAWCSS